MNNFLVYVCPMQYVGFGTCTKKFSLFILNSNIMTHPVFYLATIAISLDISISLDLEYSLDI